jgi:hypothetical protein
MEASKVSISPEHLRFEVKGRNKRADLRRRNFLELIRSKPAGTPITLAEFQEAGAYSTTAAAYGLLKTMLDRGTIVRNVEGLNRHSYVIAADVVKASQAADVEEVPKPVVAPDPPQRGVSLPTITNLEDMAKQYAWESGEDSLRGFVQWFKVKTLDEMIK